MGRDNRIYNFTIGKPLKVSDDFFVPLKNENFPTIALEDYYDKDDPNAYLFSEHNIVFSASKSSLKQNTNSCRVTLYNLDDDVVKYLQLNSSNNLVAILEAGDNETGLLTIFKGTVIAVTDDFTTQDRKTIIHITDGGFNVKNAFTVRSYPRNTPKETIIQDLAKDLKLPFQKLSGVSGNIQRPMSLFGNPYEILKKQGVPVFDTNVSIQNGALSAVPFKSRVRREASFISQDTGLVGRVSYYNDDTKSQSNTSSTASRSIQFTCALDGAIYPDESVYVKDGDFDGAYKVVDVKYEGNLWGDPWFNTVIAVETDGIISE